MIALRKIFGKDDTFFRLLVKSADEAGHSVQVLDKILRHPDRRPALDEFVALRRKEKEITREISARVVKTLVSTLEREDVEALSTVLYKIPKTVEKFAERYLLSAHLIGPVDFTRHADMLDKITAHVQKMVRALRGSGRLEEITEHGNRLQEIEREADQLLHHLLQNLYSEREDLMRFIALRDLYELLEKVFNLCRDAGQIVTRVVLKQA
jgi:uncharacterized protein Yka (UPF0111/DUF47 family)